jgi:glycosyltransferase involved in cell wall biosynthesis
MTRVVAHYIDTAVCGGAEQVLLQLIAGLDRAEWRPLLFVHDEPGLKALFDGARGAGVEPRMIPTMRGAGGLLRVPAFARALRRERVDLLHAHLNWSLACAGGLLAAALARIPVVATVHLWGQTPDSPMIPVLRRAARSIVVRHIGVSSEIGARLVAEFGLPPERVRVVHNGVPCRSLPAGGPAAAGRKTGEAARVVMVARLEVQKDHLTLIRAASMLGGVRFLLAGEGPLRAVLEAEVSRLGLQDRVVFLGQRDDVPQLLVSSDLFVLPSLHEGMPLSLLEAMAHGLPVVASSVGGIREVVTDGVTGLLVAPSDPAALAGAIRRLLDDPSLARRLAAAARENVLDRFSVEAMVRGVSRVYREVLEPSADLR